MAISDRDRLTFFATNADQVRANVRDFFQSVIPRKLAAVNFAFVMVLIVLSVLTYACLGWMISVRDYAKLQALEGKHQEQVVYQLARYFALQDVHYLKDYLDSLDRIEALVVAHESLLKEPVQYEDFVTYLIHQGIEPRSAMRVSQLVRLNIHREDLRQAIQNWIVSNQHLLEQGQLVKNQIRLQNDPKQFPISDFLIVEITEKTRQMRLEERRFQDDLAKFSDSIKWGLMLLLSLAAGLLLILGFVSTRRLGHAVSKSLAILEEGATLAAKGDFAHSIEAADKAEIREIAHLFNEVTQQLVQARADYESQKALLNETQESIAVSMAQKAEFLAAMSHQIRTPMGSVLGMIELLKDTELNPDQERYLQISYEASEGLMRTLSEILDYSQLDTGRFELASTTFAPVQALESTLLQHLENHHWDRSKIGLYIAPKVPTSLNGDAERIMEVVEHYLRAVREVSANAQILMICSVVRQSYSHVRLRIEFRLLDLHLNEDPLLALFSGEAGTENYENHGGHGLGLALSKRLVRLMDGKYGGESLPGKGVRLWFTMMLKKPKLQEIGLGEGLRGVKALYVGAKGVQHWVVRNYLTDWGLVMDDEISGTAVLNRLSEELAKGNPYQVLIMDADIESEDGMGVSRAVNISPRLSKVGCVFIGDIDAEQAREIGITTRVNWPLRRREFYDAILEAANLKQPTHIVEGDENRDYRFKGKVLLAEDNEVNSQVAVGMLTKLGFEVDVVGNGVLALESVQTGDYALVLMDCQMPKLDGYEASERIRTWEQSKEAQHALIIAMTAESGEDAKQRCLASGMDDYLMKPVKRRVLAEVLSKWLPFELRTDGGISASDDSRYTHVALDQTVLEELKELMEDKFEDLLNSYLEETLVLLDELDAAFIMRDHESIRKKAHNLKSSSANIGALNLSRMAAKLELSTAEKINESEFCLNDIRHEYVQVMREISRLTH